MERMRSSRVVVTLLIVAVVLAFGASLALQFKISASGDDEKAVKEVLLMEAKSIETGDIETLDKIWSHDESVLIFESGGVDKGWKNYRDHHLAPELAAFKNTKFTVSEVAVKTEGDTAWATYRFSLSADYKDSKIQSNGVGTMVFERSEDKWLIVHSHTSASRRGS